MKKTKLQSASAQPQNRLANGVYTASLTPLDNDLNIDHQHLQEHCQWLLENGSTGILLMGTTGEANSFSVRERMAALEAVVESGIAPAKLLVGTGCCAIPDTVELSRHAIKCGVQNLLMLPPFYYKNVADEGLYQTFEQVIRQIDDDRLRIYFYHFPQMSQVPYSLSLIAKLLEQFPQYICGIKDSSGDWQHMQELIANFPDFQVFAGSERFLAQILAIGGAGCISATANLSCAIAAQLFAETSTGKITQLQETLNTLRSEIETKPMIASLKQILARLQSRESWLNMRSPQVALSTKIAAQLETDLKRIDFPHKFIP